MVKVAVLGAAGSSFFVIYYRAGIRADHPLQVVSDSLCRCSSKLTHR